MDELGIENFDPTFPSIYGWIENVLNMNKEMGRKGAKKTITIINFAIKYFNPKDTISLATKMRKDVYKIEQIHLVILVSHLYIENTC